MGCGGRHVAAPRGTAGRTVPDRALRLDAGSGTGAGAVDRGAKSRVSALAVCPAEGALSDILPRRRFLHYRNRWAFDRAALCASQRPGDPVDGYRPAACLARARDRRRVPPSRAAGGAGGEFAGDLARRAGQPGPPSLSSSGVSARRRARFLPATGVAAAKSTGRRRGRRARSAGAGWWTAPELPAEPGRC